MLDALKSSNKAIGIKQSLKAVEGRNAKLVYIAEDSEEKVINRLKELCVENSVEVIYVESMKTLGKACGIEVGAAAACILAK
ncbi:MAG: 50S ribosomal protein L7ae-like protein [Clostridiales bacterium]|nr:50S ribosomal protein L7ae-like protein [Clostridiales bacterium]